MIVYEALRLLAVGLAVGAVALVAAVRFVQGMLYGMSSFDPVTLFVAAAVLAGVAVCAALVPALRAASVDPVEALRTE